MLWNAKNGSVPVDDTTMQYVCFGHGEKNFVILPGLSDGLTTVKGKAVMLAKPYQKFFDHYTVWMFSRKDELPQGCTIREMAADQAAAMEALGIEKASVMGVSQGGMIAQYLAIDHPKLVEKLVLAVTAPQVNDMILDAVGGWMELAEKGDHKQLMIDTAEKSYSPAYLKKYRKLYPLLGHLGKPKDYRRFLANARAILGFDALEDLERIACPVLILAGEEDRIVGVEASFMMQKKIPGSRLHVYKGLGHAAYEEAEDFNERVLRFLEE
ncbi:MAG: alpha/beta hydrolase [Lachnospiraceae bacterium]|nr:alpha/beta hydrolase [Lachnospiraceae bacterium]